jgi:branched-chain amino acid transport system ATP-binding protein
LLKINKINAYYGTHHVLRDVSLEVGDRELVTVIGANGAGKTTLLRTISGFIAHTQGNIECDGVQINGARPSDIVKMGICQVPEGRQLFGAMTVRENLIMGAYLRKDNENIAKDVDWVNQLFPILQERSKQKAAALSGGEQQMLAIARGLMSKPKLLLLDEPTWGLSPLLVESVAQIITEVCANVAVLLVEQDANMALHIANRGYVMELGRIVLEGSGDELLNDDSVRKSYLGL